MRFAIVHHRIPADFGVESKCISRLELRAVALVEFCHTLQKLDAFGALEIAFRLTNTIDKPWWENVGVPLLYDGRRMLSEKGGIRSTSCGDVVEYEGVFYLCNKFGWMELKSVGSGNTLVSCDGELLGAWTAY
jgi:hypothetical protein